MATNIFELVATLGLDNTGFLTGLKISGDLLQSFGSTVINFSRDVMQTGMGFDGAMASVQAVLGREEGTMENMAALREHALEQAESSVFTAEQAADAYYYMGMAGWKAEQMTAGLPAIMALAAASGEDLAMVSDIVTDSLTAFGLGADDAQRYADILAQSATNSNTNVALMGETFKYVAPIAGALGADVDDVALSIGLMANAGIKGSMAGTALRQIFTRISTNAGESEKNIGALRAITSGLMVEVRDSHGVMRDWGDIIDDCRAAWGGLDQETQIYYAKQIAGQYGMSGWLAIMNATDEDVKKLTGSLRDASGAAQAMAEIRLDSLSGDLTKLDSAMDILKIAIYDDVQGPAREVVQWATDAIQEVTDAVNENGLAGGIEVLGEKIEEAGDKWAPLLESFGRAAAPILDGLIDTLMDKLPDAGEKLASGLLRGLGDGMLENADGPGGLIGVVVGGIGEGLGLINKFKGFLKTAGEQGGAEMREEIARQFDPTVADPPPLNAWLVSGGDPLMVPDSICRAIEAEAADIASDTQTAIGNAGAPAGRKLADDIGAALAERTYSVNVRANVAGLPAQYNASAMDTGRIFTRPTIFGYAENAFQIAGDAGPEAVVGVSSLQAMIAAAVRSAAGGNTVVYQVDNSPAPRTQKSQTIILEIDGAQFARAELPYLDNESARVGVKLSKGVL